MARAHRSDKEDKKPPRWRPRRKPRRARILNEPVRPRVFNPQAICMSRYELYQWHKRMGTLHIYFDLYPPG